jgi:hypothetical protein
MRIERLKDGSGFGFKAAGNITAEDVTATEPQMEREIAESRKRPIGILVEFTGVKDVEWKARWEELRFLSKYDQSEGTDAGGYPVFSGFRNPACLALGGERPVRCGPAGLDHAAARQCDERYTPEYTKLYRSHRLPPGPPVLETFLAGL